MATARKCNAPIRQAAAIRELAQNRRQETVADAFTARVDFDIHVFPYDGDDARVEPAISAPHASLKSNEIPPPSEDCDHCAYVNAVQGHLAGVQKTLF